MDSAQQLDLPIDPQIQATEEPLPLTWALETEQPQPSEYPLDGIEGAFAMQDADTWLDNNINSEWIRNMAEDAPSPAYLHGDRSTYSSRDDI
jgi:hypothetical protein